MSAADKHAELEAQATEPLAPGGHSRPAPLVVEGAVPQAPGMPPVTAAVPVPAEPAGIRVAGVQIAQRPRHRGDHFGWPSNAAPGKPEGEVDTRS
jgi:hypothetical protein